LILNSSIETSLNDCFGSGEPLPTMVYQVG
jgi:hypothetical protein